MKERISLLESKYASMCGLRDMAEGSFKEYYDAELVAIEMNIEALKAEVARMECDALRAALTKAVERKLGHSINQISVRA